MVKVKTSELIGPALNWAVGVAEGKNITLMRNDDGSLFPQPVWADGLWQLNYCTSWAQAGPIVEREAHNLFKHNGGTEWCCACNVPRDGYTAIVTADGPTPLVAAMRAYVRSKLGDTVEVPDELI